MQKQEILKTYFGYTDFRPGQELLIDSILSGRDVLGIMPTGAGKSICYQVPALMLQGITVVVSPLISLMKDQVQALNQAGVHAAYINSSLTEGQIQKAMEYAMGGRYKIIYVAPERLETWDFLCFAQRAQIGMVAVDEAHCISQWGQDFRPSYLKIVSFIKKLNARPVIAAFTATATGQVKDDIIAVLGLRDPQLLISGFDRRNLYFGVETPKNKLQFVIQYIESHPGDSGIVYCATRKNVEKVQEALVVRGIAAARYHAGLSAQERSENQEDFIYDRKPVIVATNAFGMGIDKSNVRYVLHFNMPQSMENYYQEAGRAGRDGAESECIMLFSGQDVAVNQYLLDNKPPNEELEPEENELVRERDVQRLRSMVNYAYSTGCLRKYILEYFGEYGMQRCENCSACKAEYEEQDCTEAARQIVACILELRQRYGVNVVAGTLHGDKRSKLLELGADRCASYGALQNYSEDRIKQIVRELEQREYLEATPDKYAILKVCDKAQGLLEGNDTLLLRWARESDSAAAKTRKARKSDVLNHRGLELFEALKKLRMELARAENLPPYVVFSDKTLIEMCIRLPFDRAEMLQVSGVGERKYERYGETFVAAVREFTGGRREKTYFGEQGTAQAVRELTGARPAERTPGRRKKDSAEEQMTLWTQAAAPEGETSGEVPARKKKIKIQKQPFTVTSMRAAQFRPTDMCLATELAVELNRLADLQTVQKLSGAEIMRYAAAQDWVREVYREGRWGQTVTESGDRAGFFLDTRVSQHGTQYQVVYLSAAAQQAVLDYYTDRIVLPGGEA
ncbi:MAG: DNA helicase RecQ [Acetatifactor sp.]